jgi:hypothetical protein
MDETNLDRLDELARIFAAAILRLRGRAVLNPENSQNSAAERLEVPAPAPLSVIHGS